MNADARLVADRYRLDQPIGTGAMGVVWRAHDVRLDRTVALKELLMQPGLAEAEAETARARAMREGRIAARLQHPHAICVYDVALDGGSTGTGDRVVPWLVMEYLPSRSLATVLAEQGTLPPQEAARVGRQVAAALAAAHKAGIVHRDVKPGNILLGRNGTVKITDFGISRASWDATVTRTGVLAGTPAYFAPEVARGELPGPAGDVFSLGSTLYAAVEGQPPFGLDENTLALLRTVAEGRVRPPQQAGPLSAVLMQLLADDPLRRPSMSDATAALGAVEGPAGAAPNTSGAIPPRRPRIATPTPAPTALNLTSGWPPGAAGRDVAAQNRTLRGRPAVLLAAAGCLVLLVAVLTVTWVSDGRNQPAVATSALPPAPGANGPPSAPASPGPAQPRSTQLEQAVRTYYGLLPEDTDTAWQYLGAAERAKAARGFAGYDQFWSQIDQISIRGLTVTGNTVLVNLQFDPENRRPTFERYRLTMGTAPDGRLLIESASRLGTFTLAGG
ncbi:MAG: serine/threonine protein kinase [Actinomycetota bacterium]|nr:serine/threonine protein kinase [Actinomycetota bacterium]